VNLKLPKRDDFSPERGNYNRAHDEFRLWSYDLHGDGEEELVFVSDGKVGAMGGRLQKPLWEWPLTDDLGGILDIQPAGQEHPAVVVVRSNNVAYGLDGPTGRLRWRCDGPGRPAALLPGGDSGGLPSIQFHVSKPEITIYRQAVPVGPDGKYRPPVPAPLAYDSPTADPWEIISLPWEYQGRHRMMQALVPGLACLGLLVYFALQRKWRITIGLLMCFFVIPPVIAGFELRANHKFAEQHYAWGGWYWLWPYLLGAPLGLTLLKSPLLWMLAWLVWLRWGLGTPARKRTPPGRCSEEQGS
jgi:hypothetical protein